MTIFHAIKFADVDIEAFEQLKTLPVEVVRAWHTRLIDYAVEQAKSCVHLDETGRAQRCIELLTEYRAGKITKEEFEEISICFAANNSSYSADYASSSASYSHCAGTYAELAAYRARAALGMNPDLSKVKAEHDILFKKWLTEELMMFEIEVTN